MRSHPTPDCATRRMSEPTSAPVLAEQLAGGALDGELLALVWMLAELGVPLTVAAPDATAARELRNGICALLPADRHAADLALAGGTVVAASLEDVLRVLGGGSGHTGHGESSHGESNHREQGHGEQGHGEIADEVRDLGIVLVLRDGRVVAAHYIRPVERDGAGHLQRRPPALLAAWSADAPAPDHFYWAITDELATRAGHGTRRVRGRASPPPRAPRQPGSSAGRRGKWPRCAKLTLEMTIW